MLHATNWRSVSRRKWRNTWWVLLLMFSWNRFTQNVLAKAQRTHVQALCFAARNTPSSLVIASSCCSHLRSACFPRHCARLVHPWNMGAAAPGRAEEGIPVDSDRIWLGASVISMEISPRDENTSRGCAGLNGTCLKWISEMDTIRLEARLGCPTGHITVVMLLLVVYTVPTFRKYSQLHSYRRKKGRKEGKER